MVLEMVSENRQVAFLKTLYVLERKGKKTLDPAKKLTIRKKLVKQPKVIRYIDFKGSSGLIRVLERTTDHFPEFALYMRMSKPLRKSLVDAGFTEEQANKWVLRTNRFSIFVYT